MPDVVASSVVFIVLGTVHIPKEDAATVRVLDCKSAVTAKQLAERETQLQESEAKRVAFEQKYLGSLPGIGSASSRMEAARTEMRSWPGCEGIDAKLSVIPCCVDTTLFNRTKVTAENQAEALTRLGLAENDEAVVYLGSVGTWYMWRAYEDSRA